MTYFQKMSFLHFLLQVKGLFMKKRSIYEAATGYKGGKIKKFQHGFSFETGEHSKFYLSKSKYLLSMMHTIPHVLTMIL